MQGFWFRVELKQKDQDGRSWTRSGKVVGSVLSDEVLLGSGRCQPILTWATDPIQVGGAYRDYIGFWSGPIKGYLAVSPFE